MRTHLIYAFVDDLGKPFYVGKTYNLEKRLKEHLYEVKKDNNLPKYNKIRKLLKDNIQIEDLIKILENNIDFEVINEREIYWISKLKSEGYKLKNLTDGGEGAINTIPGLSEKLKNLKTGKKLSKETKEKISNSKKGKKFTEEHKINLSISRKKRITKDETRIKASKTSKGNINTKIYKLTDPSGNVFITKNGLSDFCEKNNLSRPNLLKVIKGLRKHHKGWIAEKA